MTMAIRASSFSDRLTSCINFIGSASVFLIPMKALAVNVGGNTMYLPYLGMLVFLIFHARKLLECLWEEYRLPIAVLTALTLFHFAFTDLHLTVFIYLAKIIITLLVAALYMVLLRQDEEKQVQLLYAGCVASIVYMVYQAISVFTTGGHLPLTEIPALEIGRGISSRFGFPRMTGFTEEPSYIAVVLLGVLLLLHSYGKRSGQSQTKRMMWIGFGLLLCTSNSLFFTLPLVFLFVGFSFLRIPMLFFIIFYAANFLIMPYVINIDESFFARFQSYKQFLALTPFHMVFGNGFNQYSLLEVPYFFSEDGTILYVRSIASLWGGVLFEGGIVFAALFCQYITWLFKRAQDGFGMAFIAILLMLANYYSPWWPIVSFALAYTAISRTPFRRATQAEIPGESV